MPVLALLGKRIFIYFLSFIKIKILIYEYWLYNFNILLLQIENFIGTIIMNINEFFSSFLMIINEMSPYLLLGFLIAGILHVFVPKKFYKKYLSSNNKFSVLWAAILGVPLPLCSCGVIPTAIGLKNENASKGAVASFLIATPQTGIDSILATFSVMGLGFAIIRPVAALITGICGGLLINKYVTTSSSASSAPTSCSISTEKHSEKADNILRKLYKVFRYAYFDMIQNIGLRLIIGLLLAALINIAIPDEFFLHFGSQPLLQMLIILLIAVPMYICSTGSIPVATALILKGLSPAAALVMLMAGPAVNLASILVVKKSLGGKFTWIYLLTIIIGSIFFGFLIDIIGITPQISVGDASCCTDMGQTTHQPYIWRTLCSILLVIFIIYALTMKFLDKFKTTKTSSTEANAPKVTIYNVDGMHCNHCKRAVEEAVLKVKGVQEVQANVSAHTLTVTGNAKAKDVQQAVESAGFDFLS